MNITKSCSELPAGSHYFPRASWVRYLLNSIWFLLFNWKFYWVARGRLPSSLEDLAKLYIAKCLEGGCSRVLGPLWAGFWSLTSSRSHRGGTIKGKIGAVMSMAGSVTRTPRREQSLHFSCPGPSSWRGTENPGLGSEHIHIYVWPQVRENQWRVFKFLFFEGCDFIKITEIKWNKMK